MLINLEAPASIGRPSSDAGLAMLPLLFSDPAGALGQLVHEHGPLVLLEVGPVQALLVTDPDGVREVLVEQQHCLAKGAAVQSTRPILGDGLLTSEGAHHARQRRLVSPAFHRPQLAKFAVTMGQIAAEETGSWVAETVIDAHAAMTRTAMRIVGSTLFGLDVTGDAARVGVALDGVLAISNRLLPLAQLVGQGLSPDEQSAAAQLIAELDDVIAGIIAQRRAAPGDRDVVSLLTGAVDDEGDGGGLSDREIRDEVMTLFLAGHETTANALAWTLHLLSHHPEALAQIAAEADRCGTGTGAVGLDQLEQLPITQAALREGMRLFPPAWLTTREVVQPTTIRGVDLAVGAQVIVSPWLTQRDPRWLTDADEFRIDRWLYPDEQRPKWAYFPFGGGARGCIGEHFAMLEATIILAEVARRWTISPAGDAPEPEFRVTLRPTPAVPLRLQRRAPH